MIGCVIIFHDCSDWIKVFHKRGMAEAERFFEKLEESAFKSGIEALEHRLNKCIETRGECVIFMVGLRTFQIALV